MKNCDISRLGDPLATCEVPWGRSPGVASESLSVTFTCFLALGFQEKSRTMSTHQTHCKAGSTTESSPALEEWTVQVAAAVHPVCGHRLCAYPRQRVWNRPFMVGTTSKKKERRRRRSEQKRLLESALLDIQSQQNKSACACARLHLPIADYLSGPNEMATLPNTLTHLLAQRYVAL